MIFKLLFGIYLFFSSTALTHADGYDVYLPFNNGVYSNDEWVVTDNEASARFLPRNKHQFTYLLNKGDHGTIKGVSMQLQLCTTIAAAKATVYIKCGGTRDGFLLRTYPHPELWKKTHLWQMSSRCLKILNRIGKMPLFVKVYWDGRGVFKLLNLKIELKTDDPKGLEPPS